jgi:two-component system, chemotaxis family, sensor kinase CheA
MSFSPNEHTSELRELFFESAEEILQGLNDAALAFEKRPDDTEQLRHVRRAVHTLKGDSAACGFRELSELAHELEDVLAPELIQENAGAVAAIVLTAADAFHDMLAAYRNDTNPAPANALHDDIKSLLRKPAVQPQHRAEPDSTTNKIEWTEYEQLMIAEALRGGETVFKISLSVNPEAPLPAAAFELARKALEGAGRVLALHPKESAGMERIARITAALSTAQAADWVRNRCQVPFVIENIDLELLSVVQSAPRDVLEILLEAEAAASAASVKPGPVNPAASWEQLHHESTAAVSHAPAAPENSLRVDAARIDTVMNLIGELIISKSMLQRTVTEFERRHVRDPLRAKFYDALAFQSRVLGELQHSVMKIRMVPVEQLFRRFPRIVRDVAKARNKDMVLEITGQNTDLDKSILDALAEPLAHLVRNAADHGIESAAERQAAGKPLRGTIRLNAYHDCDQVVIEVTDDGRGLNPDKILRRALERGILSSDDALRIKEYDVLQLAFTPGLSTADEVTEISGRGVGLDIVKSVLEKLKGSVELKSEVAKGTTFRLLVPFTLASIQALLFRSHGRLYAVPLGSVIEITRIGEEEIHSVDGHEVFRLRDKVLTLVRLDGLGTPVAKKTKRIFIIVVGAGNRRFGLAVDSLMGEEELVIKALDDPLLSSPLVSGASILGDGTVVLILNVGAVVSQFAKSPAVGVMTS